VQLGAEVGMGLRILRQQLRRLAQRRERILLLTQSATLKIFQKMPAAGCVRTSACACASASARCPC